MQVQILGSGTPLGLGGRLQACILVQTADERRVLLDCGMTALVSLARAGIAPETLDAIVVSHLHGDHFGGLPLVLLEHVIHSHTRRRTPLVIAGPIDLPRRVQQALEVLGWPTVWERSQRDDQIRFVSLAPRAPLDLAGLEVTALAVPHDPATAATALRVRADGRTLAYSGDAGWSPALVEAAAGADLFISGVWSRDTPDPTFLDYASLLAHRHEFINCRRLILTHLGPSLLGQQHALAADGVEWADDGMLLDL
jgi:ribonuclease BN (tRNA processing enzyme)